MNLSSRNTSSVAGMKKRQQINSANKTMFLWIIIASVMLSVCLVVSQFLIKEFLYNAKVLGAMQQTNKTLLDNDKKFTNLKTEVNKLVSDQNLTNLRVEDSDTALQVIIDALPTEDDRAALGASLQQVILNQSGVSVDSLDVMGVSSGSSTSSDAATGTTATGGSAASPQSIQFSMTLVGTYDQIKQSLHDINRSIRPFDINNIKLEGSGDKIKASISATTYFMPAKSVQLREEKV